ncbi:hypothetical protein ACJBTP_11390, partial [Streptococcus suis]
MKVLVMSYMVIYLFVTLGAALFSYLKTQKMKTLRLILTILSMILLTSTMYFYSQSYHDLHLV